MKEVSFEYETDYYLSDTRYLLKNHGNALEKDHKYDAMIKEWMLWKEVVERCVKVS